MKNTDIKSVYYNNNEVVALYLGNILLFTNTEWFTKVIKGKFADDSTENNWYCRVNGTNKTTLPVDSTTKEFTYKISDELTSCYTMFSDSKIEKIESFPNTINVKNMSIMFGVAKSLVEVNFGDNFYTENCENMSQMFRNCLNLISLNLGDKFDMGKVSNADTMFYNCNSLSNVTGKISNLKVDLDIHYSPLTNSSAMVFINGLSEVEETKNLTFNSTTYDELSEDQIALATSKGWSVIKGV